MIRVMVAEDELPLLRGIGRMIEGQNPVFSVVKLAKTAERRWIIWKNSLSM